MECYVALAPFSEEGLLTEALAQTKRCLNNPMIRAEAVRNVLVRLFNAHPDDVEFLGLYAGLLQGVTVSETPELVEIALSSMPTLSDVHPNHILALLKSGFLIAAGNWKAFGEMYETTLMVIVDARTRCDPKKRFSKEGHLDPILSQIQGQIATHEQNLLGDASRAEEYAALGRMIVAIHNALGDGRTYRPKNRYVVSGTPQVVIHIETVDGARRIIDGHVKNFAVAHTQWQGGAWVLASVLPPAVDREWRRAMVTVSHPRLSRLVTIEALVRQDDQNNYGFRVTWPEISVENAALLQQLGDHFHITR